MKKNILKCFSILLLSSLFFLSKNASAKSIDVSNSYLGRGINLLNNSKSASPMLGSNILNLSSDDTNVLDINKWMIKSNYFSSTEELVSSFSESFDENVSALCPTINVSTMSKFNISKEMTNYSYYNSMYYYYSSYLIKNTYYIKDFTNPIYQTRLKDFIIDQIKDINNNPTEEKISSFINNYGSHLIVGYNYGSSCDLFYSLSSKTILLQEQVSSEIKNETNLSIDDIPFNITSKFASKFKMSDSTFNSEVTVNYNVFGVGPTNTLPRNATENDYINWKNSLNDNDFGCIGYTNDGLIEIYNFFPAEYENAINKTKEYINQHKKIDIKVNNESTSICLEKKGTTHGGGNNNVSKWTTPQINIDRYRKLGYTTAKITLKCWLEKKSSDQGYISVWTSSEENDNNFIWVSNNFKIAKGWNEQIFLVYYNDSRDIPLSKFNSDFLALKFDAWGIWYYNVGDVDVIICFE